MDILETVYLSGVDHYLTLRDQFDQRLLFVCSPETPTSPSTAVTVSEGVREAER